MNIKYPDPEREEREEREEEEELFENMFVDTPDQLQSSATSKESLHLYKLFAKLEYQDNPLALVIYQPPSPLPGNPQMAATQSTFSFPIPT